MCCRRWRRPFPPSTGSKQGAYFFSRVVQHGKRRAEEMREAANTVREAGFEPFMAAAIADKQQWVADQAAAGVFEGLAKDARWQDYADRLIARAQVRLDHPGRTLPALTTGAGCVLRAEPASKADQPYRAVRLKSSAGSATAHSALASILPLRSQSR